MMYLLFLLNTGISFLNSLSLENQTFLARVACKILGVIWPQLSMRGVLRLLNCLNPFGKSYASKYKPLSQSSQNLEQCREARVLPLLTVSRRAFPSLVLMKTAGIL